MEIDGNTFEALLEDISLGGAFIKVNDGVPESLQVGDVCSLTLCYNSDSSPGKHSCRVVRHDSVSIGVRFLTNRFQ